MYLLQQISNGKTSTVFQDGEFERVRSEGVVQSRLRPSPFVVIREGFGDPLLYCWRGRKLSPAQMVEALTEPLLGPVVSVPASLAPAVTPEVAPPTDVEETPMPRRRRTGPVETKARAHEPTLRKQSPGFVTGIDEDQGIVSAIVSVFGVVDDGDDVIHPGAFLKTLNERGNRVRVLNNHDNRDLLSVVGKPLAMREIGRAELPPAVLAKYPDATGGLLADTQYLLNDPTSRAVYERIKAGLVDEYSIGFDITQKPDFAKQDRSDGTKRTVRNIREVRLWEYSPVIWGMNSATTTVGVKANGAADHTKDALAECVAEKIPLLIAEGKPQDQAVAMAYSMCEDGKSRLDDLSETDKAAWIGAFLKVWTETPDVGQAESAAWETIGQVARKEYTPDGPVQRLGDHLLASLSGEATECIFEWLESGLLDDAESTLLSTLCLTHLRAIRAEMSQDVALRPLPESDLLSMLLWSQDGGADQKAGRVLSAANYGKIEQASALLMEVMQAATPAEETEGKSGGTSPVPSTAPDGPLSRNAPTSTEAGPRDDISTHQAALLSEIEQQLTELEGLS